MQVYGFGLCIGLAIVFGLLVFPFSRTCMTLVQMCFAGPDMGITCAACFCPSMSLGPGATGVAGFVLLIELKALHRLKGSVNADCDAVIDILPEPHQVCHLVHVLQLECHRQVSGA